MSKKSNTKNKKVVMKKKTVAKKAAAKKKIANKKAVKKVVKKVAKKIAKKKTKKPLTKKKVATKKPLTKVQKIKLKAKEKALKEKLKKAKEREKTKLKAQKEKEKIKAKKAALKAKKELEKAKHREKMAKIREQKKAEAQAKKLAKQEAKNKATKIGKIDGNLSDLRLRFEAGYDRKNFKIGDFAIYPSHGIGKIVEIEKTKILGQDYSCYIMFFEREKLSIKVPVKNSEKIGLRHLVSKEQMEEVFAVLRSGVKKQKGMWSRRAQEYESKINSGDILALAEVLRDLTRDIDDGERSYSERIIYETAVTRLAAEYGAINGVALEEAKEKVIATAKDKIGSENQRQIPDDKDFDDFDDEEAQDEDEDEDTDEEEEDDDFDDEDDDFDDEDDE